MMSDETRLTVIDKVNIALESGDAYKLEYAHHLLSLKCRQNQIPILSFLANEIFNKKGIEKSIVSDCPYCGQGFQNVTGLKAHLGRKHADVKNKWSKTL